MGDDKAAPISSEQSEDVSPIPSEEAVMKAWGTLPELYKNRSRLSSSLAAAKVETREEDGIRKVVFYVMNVSQKQWIEERLIYELEGRLAAACSSSKIKLEVEVTPETEVKVLEPYLPEERAKDLISKNEEVKNMVIDLGLDIK